MTTSPDSHFDVLVVGAGLSGVGAAYRLQTECPGRTFAILEGRARLGGTWDLFKYPGVRSDSDMFTLGFPFHPWTAAKAIADGADILEYIRDTADSYGITEHIRYQRRVARASWSSADALWSLTVEGPEGAERYTCSFLYLCSGYYDYEAGHTPNFEGIGDFEGEIIHPQKWPDTLDIQGKRIVVIGSGATAVTLVPTLARSAAHVTMVQRSPTYVASAPARDVIADAVRKYLPGRTAHPILRFKNALLGQAFYQYCKRYPESATRFLKRGVRAAAGKELDVDKHFTPTYNPWDQRLCLVPDADLFVALKDGSASVVTDTIRRFTKTGVELGSGEELKADIIVTATGLTMVAWGGIQVDVDGAPIAAGDTYVYKGLMFSGVPNFAWCVGYTNASWTLRADLSSRYVCRLLNYMAKKGYASAAPERGSAAMTARPILDLSSGYVQRAVALLPKQGDLAPWFLRQNFFLDSVTMRTSNLAENMRFSRARGASANRPPAPPPRASA